MADSETRGPSGPFPRLNPFQKGSAEGIWQGASEREGLIDVRRSRAHPSPGLERGEGPLTAVEPGRAGPRSSCLAHVPRRDPQ